MGTLLLLSLVANFVLSILLLVRIVRADDRLDAAELAAAIDFALDELAFSETRPFLRLLRTRQIKAIAMRYGRWPGYRDRHIAANMDLTV